MTAPQSDAPVKCVVWDLDDTVWEGVLAEGGGTALRPGVDTLLRTLDSRGVLHSVASRNEPGRAMERLEKFGLAEYFLCPQIGWQPKSHMLRTVAQELNISLDSMLFVDDSPFERAEVADACPEVRCLDSADLMGLADRPDLDPPVTPEARERRLLYRRAELRRAHEESFEGPRVEFLRSLDMRLAIAPAGLDDLARAAELTQRTHQLNTTGLEFSADELRDLMRRDDQTLLVMSLEDRFGSYGIIGLVLLGLHEREWRIRLFLMSCRVMGRNVGGAVLTHLARTADARGLVLSADFLPNEVNRPMYMVYRLTGFKDAARRGPVQTLRLPPDAGRDFPDYLQVEVRS